MTDNERARFEVLLEDIQVRVGVMAEGHTMLVAGQAELRAEVAHLARGQVELQAGVAALARGQTELRADVAGLKTDVAGLKQGQVDIRAEVHDLRVSLEPRIARIERHLGLEGPARQRARRPAAKR